MRTNSMFSRLGAMLIACALLLVVAGESTYAAGTAAGTAITNTVTVNYSDQNSNARTPVTGTSVIYVAHRVNGSYTPASATDAGVDNRTIYYAVQFTNTGNRSDDFNITFNSNAGYTVDMMNDVSNNGTYDGSEAVITSTGSLAADATKYMLVRVIIAAGRSAAEAVTITATLTSTAVDDAGNNIVVANPGATFPFSINYTVQKPVIVVTVTNAAALNSATNQIPGSTVTYNLQIQNTGNADVTGSSTLSFGWDNVNTVNATSADGDANATAHPFTWTIVAGNLTAGNTATRSVTVTIEQSSNSGTGVANGTLVTVPTTSITLSYNDGYAPHNGTLSSNSTNNADFNVDRATGVLLTEYNTTPYLKLQSTNPSSSLTYFYSFKNTGNSTDGFTFAKTVTGTSGTISNTYAYYLSTNTPGDPSTATYGSALGTFQATSISAGTTLWIKVVVTIGAGASDAAYEEFKFSGTTQANVQAPTGGALSTEVTLYRATATAPNLSVTVTGGASDIISSPVTGQVVPGTIYRYTITVTNGGTGSATSVSVSNVGYAHTGTNVFQIGTIYVDPAGSSFGGGTISIGGTDSYNSGGITVGVSSGVITVTFDAIPASGVRSYRYNVLVQ